MAHSTDHHRVTSVIWFSIGKLVLAAGFGVAIAGGLFLKGWIVPGTDPLSWTDPANFPSADTHAMTAGVWLIVTTVFAFAMEGGNALWRHRLNRQAADQVAAELAELRQRLESMPVSDKAMAAARTLAHERIAAL